MRYFFLLSLALHILVFIGIASYEREEKKSDKEVEVFIFSSNSGKSISASRDMNFQKNRTYKSLGSITKLLPQYDTASKANSTTSNGDNSELGGTWQGEFIANAQATPFVASLWSRINGHLIYPEDFIQQNIEGGVTVKIVVDSQGRLKELVGVETHQIFLELFITSYIYQVLRQPLPEKTWQKSNDIPLTLHFDFQVSANEFQEVEVFVSLNAV